MIDFYNFYREMSGNTLNPRQYDTLNKLDNYSRPILSYYGRGEGKTSFSSMYLAYQIGANPNNTHCVVRSTNELSTFGKQHIDYILAHDKYKELFPNAIEKSYLDKLCVKDVNNRTLLVSTSPNFTNIIGIRINGIFIFDDPLAYDATYANVEKFKNYFKNTVLPIVNNYNTRVLLLTSDPKLTMDYLLK